MSISALAFIAIFCSGLFLCIVGAPFFGVLLYEFEYFLNPANRWWYQGLPDLRFSLTVAAVLFLSFWFRKAQFRENRILAIPQFRWLAAMTVLVCVTYFWAIDTTIHLDIMIRYLKFLFFIGIMYKVVDSAPKLESALGVYLAGIFYISWVGWQTGRTGAGRLESIGGPDCLNSNEAAAVLVTAIPLLIFYALYGKKLWVQGLALVAMAFTMNCLVLINSRGAILGLICASAYLLIFMFRQKVGASMKIKILLGICGAAAAFLYLSDESFWERMKTLRVESDEPDDVPDRRVHYWMATFKMLADNPLGLGGRGYHILSPYYLPPEWLTGGQRAVHSLWFEVLSEYGFQGLFVFLGFIFSSFLFMRKVRKHLKEQGDRYHLLQSVALEAAFVAFLITTTFINRFYGEMLYWLPCFMAIFANVHLLKQQAAPVNVEAPVT